MSESSRDLVIKQSYHIVNEEFKNLLGNKQHGFPVVQIFHGPYNFGGIVKHRPGKLYGLIEFLHDNNCNIELIPIGNLNRLEIVLLGYIIYEADIRYLRFNISVKDDIAGTTATNAVKEAIERFYGDNNIPCKNPFIKPDNFSDVEEEQELRSILISEDRRKSIN